MLYKRTLEDINIGDEIQLAFQAGTLLLQCVFRWPQTNKEQYDAFQKVMKRMSKGDPLTTGGKGLYTYDYDYIDYYKSFYSLNAEEIDQWLAESTSLPLSLFKQKSRPIYQRQLVVSRAQTANILKDYRLTFEECNVWNVTMTTPSDTRVARVIPGGWYCYQDDSFRFRFTSYKETIGYDDLTSCTFEVETNE